MSRRRPKSSKARRCGRKARHDDQDAAMVHIHKSIAKGVAAWRLRPYHCKTCDHWHVGHTPRGKR